MSRVIYYIKERTKPVNRDLWVSDIRARCPECTGFSTTMCYAGFNTCEESNCPVDVFKADAVPESPHPRRDMAGAIDNASAVQVGPRRARGEVFEQVRSKLECCDGSGTLDDGDGRRPCPTCNTLGEDAHRPDGRCCPDGCA